MEGRKTLKRCPVCNKVIQVNDEEGSLVTRCRCVFTYPEGNHKGICPQCKNKIPINFSYG